MDNTVTASATSVGQALLNCLQQMTADPTSFPQQARASTYNTEGLVQTERLAERGINGRNRFVVGIGCGGDWSAIEAAWNNPLTPEVLEELFLEHVVLEDFPATQDTDSWGFPGNTYTVIVCTPR